MMKKLHLRNALQYCKKKQFKTKFPILYLFVLCTTYCFGQTNNCSSTFVIPVNNSCITTSYNVETAFTDSMADPSCGVSQRDGWGTFTTGASTSLIDIIGTSNRRLGIAIYSGTCGSLTEIACTSPNTANTSLANITVSPNTTYFLRLMRTNNTGGNNMNGTICIVDATATCTPTNNYSASYYISGVTTAGGVSNINNTGTGFSGYTDYTSHFASQFPGFSFTLSATHPSSTYGYNVWIDWNGNGNFNDLGENVISTGYLATPATLGTITIPGAQAAGNYRMRIRNAYLSNPAPACGSFNYGEAEDYTITVLALLPCSGTPTGGTLTVSPASGNPGSTYGVTVTGYTTGTALSYQWQYSDTGGAPWTNQGTSTSSYAPLTGMLAPALGIVRTWNLVVTCTSSGLSTSSSTGTFTSEITPCTPVSTNSSNYIDDFSTTNGITNITNNNTGYTTGGYADYTSMTASQAPGGNITFSADFIYGFSGMGVGIWVDWNNDGDFNDLNEQIYDSASYITNLNFNYTIPGVAAGTYRFRILADYWETSPDPCAFDTFGPSGEAEDYLITITPLNCTDDPTSLTGTATSSTTGTFSWTGSSPAPANGYEYIVSTDNSTNTPAGDITGTTTGTTINLTGLSSGTTYYIFVRGLCNAVDFGIWTPTTFTTGCTNIITTPTVCPIIAGEQGVDPFSADPFDPDPSFSLDCSSPTLTLQAHSTIRETDSYAVEQITYVAPVYDFPILFGGSQVISTDDVWADDTTGIGFDFNFYGQCYDEVLVGANGIVTFDLVNNTPGTFCPWSFSTNIPDGANLFEQTIFGVYHDIDPSGMTNTPIRSRTVGTAPCRQFQVSWDNIPMFTDPSTFYTGMIILHETTNIIEVFIEEKKIENSGTSTWNDGNAIVGLQGDVSNGEYAAAPCRNGLDANWETTNEAWRFVPNGAIITPSSVEWFSASTGTTVLGTNSTLTVNTPDTYTAEVSYTICGNTVTLIDDVVVDQSSKTWNGSIDTNWYVHDNWTPSGVPTLSDCVLIPDIALSNNRSPIADNTNIPIGAPIPPTLASALNLTVDTNGYVEILSGTNLQVMDWIHLDGIIDIRDSGSLIQVYESGPNINDNTGNGIINMQRTVPNGVNSYDYIYWSSPTDEDFNVTDISAATGELIYEWNPTLNGVTHGDWIAASGNMSKGKGYIVRGLVPDTGVPTNTTEFSGKPQNGVITVPINRGTHTSGPYTSSGDFQATNEDDNWNLIGNPYPSAISYADFIAANPNIDGTIYFWTHQTAPSYQDSPFYYDFIYNYSDEYIDNNFTGSNPATFGGDIAAGQAFFVLMLDNATQNEEVIFNNSMRNETLINSNFYRTNESSARQSSDIERHRIWLDLISPNEIGTSILVGYIEGATNDNDRLYDGYEFAGGTISFYSLIEEERMSIQGKALPFQDTDTVPLGIVIPENGNYSIAINTLDGLFQDTNQAIFIEDTYTNTIHNLRVNPYSFNINTGTYNDRFILRYTDNALSIEDYELSGLEIIAPNNSFIKVKSGNDNISTVIVYDLLGRVLINKTEINASEIRFNNHNFSEGAYIVKAILSNGKQKIQKVVLKP
ncbi:T9SS type A sorting domain-containing protein [Lacinutrix sp. WUR7]|uniref:GEVED domain-containing protein n=1 Tax=Lacinutrix sp. WUR7 TaxID=2653681 RepID=UPI00193CA403|nr:GEVED domain-containing protein [Lacinutrix sp. WUR7]QRM89407.1 T9SS type A sorting domain-containing protein [Lacinutrix sp. WUR7]